MEVFPGNMEARRVETLSQETPPACSPRQPPRELSGRATVRVIEIHLAPEENIFSGAFFVFCHVLLMINLFSAL